MSTFFILRYYSIFYNVTGEDDYTKVGKVDDNVVVLVNQKPINESHCFLVNITDDDIVEDIEQFTITLHVAVNDQILLKSVTIQPDTIVITIIDDDGKFPILKQYLDCQYMHTYDVNGCIMQHL